MPRGRRAAGGPALLKEIAKDAATVVVVLVCTVVAVIVLFWVTYSLIGLFGRGFPS